MSEAHRGHSGDSRRHPRVDVRADLDVPGETGRQARIFLVWFLSLAIAVVIGAALGAHVPITESGSEWAEQELARARTARIRVGLVVGLLLPSVLSWALQRHYRRGGSHARGIVVDVTEDGELRIWGRGYGQRVALADATVTERLVDVYAGRLGAWRQRRLRVRGQASSIAPGEIELATLASASDEADRLRVEGGEGNCVELARQDFDRVRAAVLELATRG